ncbi:MULTISPECIES: antA/AntB antirepressor family protein [unclassified Clostridium]|uniref:antA/AntB antirepressor family protein n=1 Tax=unclassified Clostridium TaxID=2614128 RepID=UPI0013EE86D4|nr:MULTISPECIES: antA/AntB antirepressor family protein [unclassified Clostridium]MBZ9693412.1 antA/AntB antirepressor family protein [Clostridium sp. M14]
MKTIQRNKIKFKIFEEDELKYQLKMREEDMVIVLNYQDKFPELMIENGDGFCIDARLLHKNLVENSKDNKTGDRFSQWIKRRINKYSFKENEDYITFHNFVNRENTNLKSKTNEYKLTLEMAKQLAMIENNKLGLLCRKYFILMEKTLKNYEEWSKIREPEKEQAKVMKKSIQDWCNRNQYDSTLEIFYTREFNMLNESLTGELASGLRIINECKDNSTRNHLDKDTNDALLKLQEFNIQLLNADMSFEERTKLIKNLCRNKYSNLYLKIN